MRYSYLFLVFTCFAIPLFSQGVGIGTQDVASSALLELQSSTKGTLLTRMTSGERKAISNPETGLLVFDTDKHTLYMYDGHAWLPLLFSTTESMLPPFGVSAEDATLGDNFGYSVDISGIYAVVGTPYDKIGNNSVQGSAYIFKKIDGIWIQQDKISSSDGASEDYFGSSVSIDGDYIVIGAPSKTFNMMESAGRVYVFLRNGEQWVQQANLQASDAGISDHFGFDVAISGNYVVVGAPYNDVGGQADRGCAYVFMRSGTTWTQQAVINPALGLTGDHIGKDVAIDGAQMLIGAPNDDNNGQENAGCVYYYKRIGNLWSMHHQFLPQSVQANAYFGAAIALEDTIAVIGCPNLDYLGFYNLGVVIVYFNNGTSWYKHAEIIPDEHSENSSFGSCVDVSDGLIAIGAPYQQVDFYTSHGKAWVYQQDGNGWKVVRQVIDMDGQSFQQLGYAIGIHGHELIVSANQKNHFKGEVFFVNLE